LLDGIVDFDEIVAGALGITVDELDAAREAGTPMPELIDELGLDQETVRQEIQSAVEAAVEQAVTDGTLTEEEAEAFLNPPAPPQRGQGEGPGELLDGIVDLDEIVAGVLGITVDELDAAREAGTPMPELIDELGLDQETVRQEIQSAVEAAVEQAVTDGTLTEEEAEQIITPPSQRGRGQGGEAPPPAGDDSGDGSDTAPTGPPDRGPRNGGGERGGRQ
jgi:coenzyme F420-reducing hydrogenase delta subunit